jgi:Leucine-rich repeat (LRR) protein
MKKLLLILLCLPMIGFGQQTYVPDDNFENYLENNGMGDGIALNDYVYTSAIDTATNLYVSNQSISDLTGIEEFSNLEVLDCQANQLTNIDISSNQNLWKIITTNNPLGTLDVQSNYGLIELYCAYNQLSSLDLSNNSALEFLQCEGNNLNSLDVSNSYLLWFLDCEDNNLTSLNLSSNPKIEELDCAMNQIEELDFSNNSLLEKLNCSDNQLTELNIKNGYNINITLFNSTYNTSLSCIEVDNANWSTINLTNIDPQHYFSTDCSVTVIDEIIKYKELLKIIDVLGRDTKGAKYEPLFYIYDDGTVEKRIVIE